MDTHEQDARTTCPRCDDAATTPRRRWVVALGLIGGFLHVVCGITVVGYVHLYIEFDTTGRYQHWGPTWERLAWISWVAVLAALPLLARGGRQRSALRALLFVAVVALPVLWIVAITAAGMFLA